MMKEVFKQGLSVFLIFAMMLSLSMVPVSDVQAAELSDESDKEEEIILGSDETDSDESEQKGGIQDETEKPVQDTSEGSDTSDQMTQTIDELEDDEEDEDQDPSESIVAEYPLTMQYDDHVSLADVVKEDLTEYPFIKIETVEVTSFQVSGGEVTDESDEVVQYDADKGTLIASGTGSAAVTFSKTENEENENERADNTEDNNDADKTEEGAEDCIKLNVTVEPAVLTMMFIAGQSNAEGTTSSGAGLGDSVACEEGTVYSTYAPASSSSASKISGISGLGACTVDNATSYVAGSLTGTTSLSGTELVYPLNTLTTAGNGKTGMDGGLAYQWHNDTGDKVWVVNAGYSATSISKWVPGAECYERATAILRNAIKTADAEINAGHYTDGHRLLFWLQGEDDTSMSVATYRDSFRSIYEGFDNEGLGIEKYGIIMVRACTGSYTTSADLAMTGPRMAQYLMGNSSSDSKVYVVSNVNEQWVTDNQVQDYFQSVYGGSLSYPTHSGISGLPTTVEDVHADVHYSQVGHNENGLTAAEGMYRVVCGGSNPVAVNWHDSDGDICNADSVIYIETDNENTFIPVADPVYTSKGMEVSGDSSGITYDENNGTVSGAGVLTAEVRGVSSSLTISSDELATPVLNKATYSNGEITVSWNLVSDATGYRVFRKTAGGSWAGIATTTDTSYADDKLESGTTYYYTVRAFRGEESKALANTFKSSYWSSFDSNGVSAKAVAILATPTLNKVSASGGSITVSWGLVSDADGYRVYRKTSGGSWSGIASTPDTSYTDSQVEDGVTYYYTVRAYKGTQEEAAANQFYINYWSDFDSKGVSATAKTSIETPHLTKATASNGSITVTWNAVSDAGGYRVFRKKSGGSWSGIGNTTSTSTSYTDADMLEIGATYYYTVRAYTDDYSIASQNTFMASYWSNFESPGVSAKVTSALSTPTLVSAKTSGGSNIVTWNEVSGAEGYRVYRKVSGGSWSGVATVIDNTSFTDEDKLEIGTTYYYTVRAFKGEPDIAAANQFYSNYWSDFDSAGVSVKTLGALATPTLVSAKSSGGSNTITWKSVSDAAGYRVYRKVSGGSWEGIGNAITDSYIDDSNLQVGDTYYYTVRAYKDDWDTASANSFDAHYWSDFESGLSIKETSQLSTPSLNKASASTAQITVTWSEVNGAAGYRVYRKTSGGSWAGIGNTISTSYTDSTNLDAGETYYYTVRAYKDDYETASANTFMSHYWSDFESSGVSATAISVLTTPTLNSATKGSSGVVVSFNSVSGAGGYRVYRKASGGSWAGIGNTTSNSYTDTSSLTSGTTYYYTVRAYVNDYSTASAHQFDVNYWSAFDTTGVKYVTVADVDMFNKAQSYSSSTKYMILVNSSTNKVGIFTGSKGNWDMKYYWSCSTGKSSTPTKKGTFTIGSKGKSFSGSSYTCWYYSQFSGNYLFHSVLYKKGSMTTISDGRLGMNISHGCVRLDIDNAKWIYDNVPKGSTVVSY